MLNNQEKAEIQSLVSKTEKEYTKKLRSNRNHIYAINLSSDLHKRIDSVVSHVKSKGVRFGCESGCSHCCNLRVEALAPEVFYIARKLRSERPIRDIESLIEKLKEFSQRAKGLRTTEHLIPCPMLSNGRCSIYEYRPMMCRKYNSLDASVCETPFSRVPESTELTMKSVAIGIGFNSSLEKRKLSSIPHELGQALLVALSDENAIARWAKGEMVFDKIPEME